MNYSPKRSNFVADMAEILGALCRGKINAAGSLIDNHCDSYEDIRRFSKVFLHGVESVVDAHLWRVFGVVGVGVVLHSVGYAFDGDSGGVRHHLHFAYGVYCCVA